MAVCGWWRTWGHPVWDMLCHQKTRGISKDVPIKLSRNGCLGWVGHGAGGWAWWYRIARPEDCGDLWRSFWRMPPPRFCIFLQVVVGRPGAKSTLENLLERPLLHFALAISRVAPFSISRYSSAFFYSSAMFIYSANSWGAFWVLELFGAFSGCWIYTVWNGSRAV